MPAHSRIAVSSTLRRCMDVSVSAATLVVLSPVLVVLGVLVLASSPGPVFYRQQRVGLGGRLFWIYKFRTMRATGGGPFVTSSRDGRITPVGRRLRDWKLDELPQFFNVLRGDMSLVGPRPEVPTFVDRYTGEQRSVLDVRPGITGVSQLRFRDEERLLSSAEDVEATYVSRVMPAKLRLDLEYIRRRTLHGDMWLLISTVIHIVRRPSLQN